MVSLTYVNNLTVFAAAVTATVLAGATPAAELHLEASDDTDVTATGEVVDPCARIRDLELRLEQTRGVVAGLKPSVVISGYVDGGFFVPQGNGSGIVRDNGNTIFPEYAFPRSRTTCSPRRCC